MAAAASNSSPEDGTRSGVKTGSAPSVAAGKTGFPVAGEVRVKVGSGGRPAGVCESVGDRTR